MVTEQIHNFTEECITHGGTTKIIDADGVNYRKTGCSRNIIRNSVENFDFGRTRIIL